MCDATDALRPGALPPPALPFRPRILKPITKYPRKRRCNCADQKTFDKCPICNPNVRCRHGGLTYSCKQGCSNLFCSCGKRISRCKTHGGAELCKAADCGKTVGFKRKYDGYCVTCYTKTYPDRQVAQKNNKLKELAVVQYIVPMFADVKWQHDKRVPGSKNGYRPDLLGDFGNMVVIVDIDENGHRQYDESKEAERMKQLAMDLGDRPLVIIRFNPDSYVNKFTQQTVQSCWRKDANGVFMVPDEQTVPWTHRLLTLRDTITYVSRYYQDLETHTFRLFFE